MKTKILLIRHAECIGNIEGRLSGRTNFKLTKNGEKQATELARSLKNKKIDIIFSSPLERAVKTAEVIAGTCNISEVNIERGLIEIDYGVCDGMRWDDIDKKYPNVRRDWKEINNYPVNIPNQEEYINVQKRMIETINKIKNNYKGKIICIVSHGIAIQSYLCHINNKEIFKAKEIPQLKNADFIEFYI